MKIDVMHDVFEKNRARADRTRRLLDLHQIRAFNIMGSPGCGKTALLEVLLPELRRNYRCAVLEGDPATTRDAERIGATGTPAVQLVTDGCCHLEPNFVFNALQRLDLQDLNFLFIENVGNLVCPANYDLGEHDRMVVLSVAEGTDKAAKYPGMFAKADAVVISKVDLLDHCDFDLAAAKRYIRRVNEAATIFTTSARRGAGLDKLSRWLVERLPSRIALPSGA